MADRPQLNILVVEDEFLIATEIATILEDAGHAVVGPAGSVAAALAALAEPGKPDFAVIDANLRGESSSPIAAELRRLSIPFCVCTGYRPSDLKAQFGEAATIQKPVNPATLLGIIAAMVRT